MIWSPWTYAEISCRCVAVILCLWPSYLILRYLKSKPYGLQGLMDEFNKLALASFCLLVTVGQVEQAIRIAEIDMGHSATVIYIYLRVGTIILFPVTLIANAVVQCLLINMSWIFDGHRISDMSLACRAFALMVVTIFLELWMILMFAFDSNPSIYYDYRHQNDTGHHGIWATIFFNWVFALVCVASLRWTNICLSRHHPERFFFNGSNHIIHDKVILNHTMLFVIVAEVEGIFGHLVFNYSKALAVISFPLFPMQCIYYNENCWTFTIRQLRQLRIVKIFVVMKELTCRFICCKDGHVSQPHDVIV